MSKLIKATGEVEDFPPTSGRRYTLEELQGAVGGYIQIVPSENEGMVLVIDEEGKMKGKYRNAMASTLYGHTDDYIVGDAVYCPEWRVE